MTDSSRRLLNIDLWLSPTLPRPGRDRRCCSRSPLQSRLRLLLETTPLSTRLFSSESSTVAPPTSTKTAEVALQTWSATPSPSWTPTRFGCRRTLPSSTLLTLVLPKLQTLCTLCLLYTSPSPRDLSTSRMPSSA